MTLLNLKRNTILAPYCDNILNHDTNEGIVKLVTLMVKHNESIASTHYNFVEKNLIPSMWPILQYPHVHVYQ